MGNHEQCTGGGIPCKNQCFTPGAKKQQKLMEKCERRIFSSESLSGESVSGPPKSVSGSPRAYPVCPRVYPVQKGFPNTLSRPESVSGRPPRAYPGRVGGESLSGAPKLQIVKIDNPSHTKTHFPILPPELIRSSSGKIAA